MDIRYPAIALATLTLSGTLMNGFAEESRAVASKRVPAEWEPQEAVWLQWPGRYEKALENACAKMATVIVEYRKLNILHDSNWIRQQARNAITKAGGNPDHDNIVWHLIRYDSAWRHDNGPVFIVEEGEMRVQNWKFDAWGARSAGISDMGERTRFRRQSVSIWVYRQTISIWSMNVASWNLTGSIPRFSIGAPSGANTAMPATQKHRRKPI